MLESLLLSPSVDHGWFETSFTKVKSESEEREIIANVFPVDQFQDRLKQVHGYVDERVEKISQRPQGNPINFSGQNLPF